jgi:hypothetical protein
MMYKLILVGYTSIVFVLRKVISLDSISGTQPSSLDILETPVALLSVQKIVRIVSDFLNRYPSCNITDILRYLSHP